MRSNILPLKFLLLIILTGIIILFSLFYFIERKPINNTLIIPIEKVEASGEQTGFGLPVSLEIPLINVNASIESLGLTSDGAMAVSKGPDDVAWYNLGPRPGEIGSAVMVGHYGWKNSIPAVFDNLSKLKKGDKIYVKDEKGATVTFVVNKVQTYGENQDASDVFYSNDGQAHLNLITCGGTWNKITKSYSNRTVVFTNME